MKLNRGLELLDLGLHVVVAELDLRRAADRLETLGELLEGREVPAALVVLQVVHVAVLDRRVPSLHTDRKSIHAQFQVRYSALLACSSNTTKPICFDLLQRPKSFERLLPTRKSRSTSPKAWPAYPRTPTLSQSGFPSAVQSTSPMSVVACPSNSVASLSQSGFIFLQWPHLVQAHNMNFKPHCAASILRFHIHHS